MGIELAEFIHQLRAELNKARQEAQTEDLQFDVGPIEVELAVEAQREGSAHGGLRIYVIEAGAHAKMANVSTQRIKLSLNPSVPDTKPAAQAAKQDVSITDLDWSRMFHPKLTDLTAEYLMVSPDGSANYAVKIAPYRSGRKGVVLEPPDIAGHPGLPATHDS